MIAHEPGPWESNEEKERREGPVVTSDDLAPELRAAIDAQAPYMALNERIHELSSNLNTHPATGVEIDIKNTRLVVRWSGADIEVLQVIRQEAAELGIHLEVRSAPPGEYVESVVGELVSIAEAARVGVVIDIDTGGTGLTVHSEGLPAADIDPLEADPARRQFIVAIQELRKRCEITIRVDDAAQTVEALGGLPTKSMSWLRR